MCKHTHIILSECKQIGEMNKPITGHRGSSLAVEFGLGMESRASKTPTSYMLTL